MSAVYRFRILRWDVVDPILCSTDDAQELGVSTRSDDELIALWPRATDQEMIDSYAAYQRESGHLVTLEIDV